MILSQTSRDVVGYSNRCAAAVYNMGGGGNPPRTSLVHNQYYVGRILDKGRFHVLKPDRMCSISEFTSFQLVSKPWRNLSERERSLLIAVYNQNKLELDGLSSEVPHSTWNDVAVVLNRAGYLRWTDEERVVELTLVGEAEVRHHLFGLDSDPSEGPQEGIRIQHHSIQDHEIDLAQSSTLAVNVTGMLIRIFTLPTSGAVIRVDHDSSHRVFMNRTNQDRNFTQVYIDRTASATEDQLDSSGESAVNNDTIRITSLDMQRLRNLLDKPDLMQQKPYLLELEREIDRAIVVQSSEVPPDTITMNSTVQLIDLQTGEEMILTLVYPEDANIAEGRVSVLAPVGLAILGCHEGEQVEWEVPDGIRSLKVDRVLYQPEAAGEYAL